MMDKTGLIVLLLLGIVTTIDFATAQSCNGCSIAGCRINNIEMPSKLVEAEVNRSIDQAIEERNIPSVQFLTLHMATDRSLQLLRLNSSTFQKLNDYSTPLASVSVSGNGTSTNNLLAYRANYTDFHNSGRLAGVFINLESLFPCIGNADDVFPLCHIASYEEDGFRGGKSIIGSADRGNNFVMFGSGIFTYGIAVEGCTEFNTACFPNYVEITVACYLPPAFCSG